MAPMTNPATNVKANHMGTLLDLCKRTGKHTWTRLIHRCEQPDRVCLPA